MPTSGAELGAAGGPERYILECLLLLRADYPIFAYRRLKALDAPFKMQPPPPFQYEPAELEEQLDTTLDEENAAFVKLAMVALAEEAAAMPDPAE